jgi:hypothetical protein
MNRSKVLRIAFEHRARLEHLSKSSRLSKEEQAACLFAVMLIDRVVEAM